MGQVAFVAVGLVVMMGVFVLLWMFRFKKAGPNEVLVIFGRQRRVRNIRTGATTSVGFRVQIGGGAFVFPILESVKRLSLEPVEVPISTAPKSTTDDVSVSLEGTARVQIVCDEASIKQAAERLLDQSPEQVGTFVGEVLEPHILGVIHQGSFDEHRNNQDDFFTHLKEASQETLAQFGLELLSLKISELRRR